MALTLMSLAVVAWVKGCRNSETSGTGDVDDSYILIQALDGSEALIFLCFKGKNQRHFDCSCSSTRFNDICDISGQIELDPLEIPPESPRQDVFARKILHRSTRLMATYHCSCPSRLAGIEEAQRDICRGTKRREFLRFARRKWLASDLAAESVQRVFRGHIGRRRAALNAEVQRLTGEARAEWVEV